MKHLSLISQHTDAELALIHETVEEALVVGGRLELEALLGMLLRAPVDRTPKTLDLIGHATAGSSLLQLGDWVIDGASGVVTAFFRGLADDDVLGRLGIHAIRLLGCNTADTGRGRATLRALSQLTGVEVYGTTGLVFASHYDARGFKDEWSFLLVAASDLGRAPEPAQVTGELSPRILDIDALPTTAAPADDQPWPRFAATRDAAHVLLRLVKRTEGATMPGLLSLPTCEILVPAAEPRRFHTLQVILDFTFIRVYPDGDTHPGVLYPVVDSHALRALCYSLTQRNPLA